MSAQRTPIYIAGPTASGKSALAMSIADSLQGEIISVDSMQVYQGMDIGTTKPSKAERTEVRHHLVDIRDLQQSFDAAQFVEEATTAIQDIQARSRLPILCGGTGLYMKALMEGLGSAPSPDRKLRTTLESTPLDALLAELERTDPKTFQRIDTKNPRRVIRAIEILRLTGKPVKESQSDWTDSSPKNRFGIYLIDQDRDDLYRRINDRVDQMLERGLVDETRHLLAHGLRENKTAMQALGYRQSVECLEGQLPVNELGERIQAKTRQFARRQATWFRNQFRHVHIIKTHRH